MSLERMLATAARMTSRHRSWWLLGLTATMGSLLANLLARGGAWYAAGQFTPGQLALGDADIQGFLQRSLSPGRLLAAVLIAFLLGLIVWLVSAVAEGGLIVAVAAQERGIVVGPGQALRTGLGLLGRFVGIDTLLFLPLFLLALALMAVGFGGLAGLVIAASRPAAQLGDLLLVTGLAMGISLPLLFLMLVTGLVILVLRALAFRAATLDGMKAGDSIRRAWRVLRDRPLAVAALALVLAALRSVAGLPLRMVSWLLVGLGLGQLVRLLAESGPEAGAGLLLALGGLVLALASWLVGAIMNAFGSAAWTLSYQAWTAGLD